jgi:hypothetical protein
VPVKLAAGIRFLEFHLRAFKADPSNQLSNLFFLDLRALIEFLEGNLLPTVL